MTPSTGFDPRWNGASIPKKHWHFHRQLLARYGMILEPGEFSGILRDIRNGAAMLIEQRSRTRAIYSVRLTRRYERIYVLWDGKNVITAWPPQRRLNEIRRRLSKPEIVLHLRAVVRGDEE